MIRYVVQIVLYKGGLTIAPQWHMLDISRPTVISRLFSLSPRRITVAETEQNKKRRVIRKVETVREKSAKAAEQTEKPSRKKQILRGFTAPLRFVGRGFKKLGSVLGRFKVMRFIGRILVPTYFRNSWKELKGVTWPTLPQSRRLSIAVMIFAVIFGVVVALLDFVLDKIFKEVLIK